jgi:hypothetical protein
MKRFSKSRWRIDERRDARVLPMQNLPHDDQGAADAVVPTFSTASRLAHTGVCGAAAWTHDVLTGNSAR